MEPEKQQNILKTDKTGEFSFNFIIYRHLQDFLSTERPNLAQKSKNIFLIF